MRRMLALAALTAFAASAAHAETWTKFDDGEKGTVWSYDADGVYKDKATGRLIVSKAISKEGVLQPGGPDKGVGFIVAIDCKEAQCLGSEGDLPFPTLSGRTMTSIDFRGP